MSTIDNESIIFQIKLCLCTQFAAKKFGWVWKQNKVNLTEQKKIFDVCILHVGGLPSALATSVMLTMTVFIPFPLPSTLAKSLGIL